MRTSTKLAALLCGSAFAMLAAAPAFAQEGSYCDPEVSECGGGGGGPPPLPSIPVARNTNGDFFVQTGTIRNSTVVQGQIRNDTYFTFGGGPSQPLPTPGGLTVGQSDNNLVLQSTFTPVVSLSAVATANTPQDPSFPGFDLVARGGLTTTYLVALHANNQQAADALTALLNTSGAIANISGAWSLTATGSSWGSVSASTGTNELDSSLAGSFYSACSLISYVGTPQGCGGGSYAEALNFVNGSVYDGGSSLDFYSQITLSVSANAGPPGLGYYPGTMSAFIDPDILFNPNLDLSQYSLSVGGLDSPLVAGPAAGGVPEPAVWALMIGGFGLAGAALRRRRAATA